MDAFTKLFGEFLVFVYHCFDRIVIHGYLTALSRPELVVHFFRDIVGVAEVSEVSKEVLSQRTNDYPRWVEAYARNHSIPIEWAEKGVRKEDHVLPWLHRMARRDTYGVYFIFKSMEQGPTYRVSLPKYPSKDPHYRILAHQRSRFTHYYFYIRDEVLGPMVLLVASFFPFQTAYLAGSARPLRNRPCLWCRLGKHAIGNGRRSLSLSREAVPNSNHCIRVGADHDGGVRMRCRGRPDCANSGRSGLAALYQWQQQPPTKDSHPKNGSWPI